MGCRTDYGQLESPQADELASVPETMINNPSSASLGTMVDVSLDGIALKSKSTLEPVVNMQPVYSTVEGQLQKQETGDDLRLDGNMVLYRRRLWNRLSARAFLCEALMDSEHLQSSWKRMVQSNRNSQTFLSQQDCLQSLGVR